MSKRYGRNQRRKHREAIALLMEATAMREAEAIRHAHTARKLEQELADWNDEIIHLLGRYTAFQRKTPTMKVRDVRDFQAMPAPIDMRVAMRMAVIEEMSAVENMTVERVLMHKLFVKIEAHSHELRLLLRLGIDGGHESRLAICEEMLAGGLTPRDTDYIAEQLARNLVAHFNKLASPYRPRT